MAIVGAHSAACSPRVVGPIVEAVIAAAGLARYAEDSDALFGVAPWLPALYFAFGSWLWPKSAASLTARLLWRVASKSDIRGRVTVSWNDIRRAVNEANAGVHMRNLRSIAAGLGIAGALGFAAVGIGAGTANAAPPAQAGFAQWGPGWGPGPGPWRPGPPPPPPPAWGGGYDYGGWNNYGTTTSAVPERPTGVHTGLRLRAV